MAPTKSKSLEIKKKSKAICLKRKEEEEVEQSSWSDLPTEILENIISGLYLNDIASFNAVCKQWSSVQFPSNQLLMGYSRSQNFGHEIPWLMATNWYNYMTSPSMLLEPSSYSSKHKKTHIVKIEGFEEPGSVPGLCSSKFGWVLVSHSNFGSDSGGCCCTSFFVYSPFINRRFDLPNLDSPFDVATFSAPPTSPDCVFFVLHYSGKVNISICHFGEMVWSSYSFSSGFSPIKDVVYLKGKFYCSTVRGGLATFDVAQKSWNVFTESTAIWDIPWSIYQSFMVGDENDGELYLGLLANAGWRAWVYKLDKYEMKWVRVKDLACKSFFISYCCTSFMISKSERTKKMMNRLYYCLPSEAPKFYSFRAQKNYRSSSQYGDLPVSMNYFWIDPPY